MLLHNKATSPSNGVELTVESIRYLGLSVSGTSTDFSISFEASLNGVDYYPIMGRKADDININFITTIAELDKIVLFDVTSFKRFRAKLTTINNGYITVDTSEER